MRKEPHTVTFEFDVGVLATSEADAREKALARVNDHGGVDDNDISRVSSLTGLVGLISAIGKVA